MPARCVLALSGCCACLKRLGGMTDEWAEVSNPGGRKSLRRGALCACVMLAMQEVSSCMHRDVTLRQYHMVRRYENVAMNVLEERKSREWECAYVTD